MTIIIKGDEDLVRRLKQLSSTRPINKVVAVGVTEIKSRIATYPPRSSANTPKDRGRWYQRGYGSKYRRKNGAVRGYKTSKTLGRRWTVRIDQGGMRGRVGNNAAYGPFVQSASRQASFHKRRGWKTDEAVIDEVRPIVEKTLLQEYNKAMK